MAHQTFLEKFAQRIDRIDKTEIFSYAVALSRDKGFLENILNSLDDGIIVLDEKRHVQFINPAARELAGIAGAEQVAGRAIERYLRDRQFSDFVCANELEGGQTVGREFEIGFPRKMFVGVSLLPLRDEAAKACGTAVIVRDMTEKRRIEGRMVQTEKIGALSVLAAGLAHEIGNPLNSLHIHVQLIEREFAKLKTGRKKLADLIKVVSDEIRRIDDIARHFLQAIRPLRPKFEEEDVNEVLESTLKVIMPEVTRASIALEKRYDKRMPRTLLDRSQLKQAFLNIIKNAAQAMPKGGSLLIETSAHGDAVTVRIADTGQGIAPENIARIFDPYFTTRANGVGLGLMMTHRIVKEHGGDIEVKSRPGKGTTFTITLPVRTLVPKMLPKGAETAPQTENGTL
ncbi:MAG TPA: ATP-binding protein [bacterium]|nr:ATP-binding protein [bacterium]